jgi:hypothetical protein
MEDEEAIDCKERFRQLPLNTKKKFKEGSWDILGRGKVFILCFWKRRKMSV